MHGRRIVTDVGSWDGVTLEKKSVEIAVGTPSPDGTLIAIVEGRDLEIREGKKSLARLYHVGAFAFSPDSKKLAGATGRSVTVWDPRTGTVLSKLEQDRPVIAVAMGDGRVASADEKAVRIWKGSEATVVPIESARSLGFGERFIAVGDARGKIHFVKIETGEIVHRVPAHEGAVRWVSFLLYGARVASMGEDGSVKLWGPKP